MTDTLQFDAATDVGLFGPQQWASEALKTWSTPEAAFFFFLSEERRRALTDIDSILPAQNSVLPSFSMRPFLVASASFFFFLPSTSLPLFFGCQKVFLNVHRWRMWCVKMLSYKTVLLFKAEKLATSHMDREYGIPISLLKFTYGAPKFSYKA